MLKLKIIKPTEKELEEFLIESNAIEDEHSEQALKDAKQAWTTGVVNFKKDFSIDLILAIHRRLAKNINKEIAGKIRTVPVYVGNRYEYRECLKPELIHERLTKLIESWNNNYEELKEMSKEDKEVFIKNWHVDFEHVHPHLDINGRTGRIIMNLQRLSVGLKLLTIHVGIEQQNYYKWFREKTTIPK